MENDAIAGRSLDAYDGCFRFTVEDVLEVPEKDEKKKRITLLSEVYNFCGLKFQLGIQPRGSFDGSEYIAVKLINLSSTPVLLEYSIALVPRCKSADDVKKHIYEWKDPEGVVRFDAVDKMDSSWGNEEFITLEEAMIDHRLLVHHLRKTKTFVEQEIDESTGEVKGEIEVEKEIESNTADEDLLNFAKDDLIKVLGDEYNKKKKKIANMDSLMDMRTRTTAYN